MPRKTKAAPYEPKIITISGNTYEAAHLSEFPLEPTSSRKIGGLGGVQYTYLLGDSNTYWRFVDHLAVAACDVADEKGDKHHLVLAIYKDLEKI